MMELVRCVNVRNSISDEISIGSLYYLDTDSILTYDFGPRSAKIYSFEDKNVLIGRLYTYYFKPEFTGVCQRSNLVSYINTNISLPLIDIIELCDLEYNANIGNIIVKYISNNIDIIENMYSEFVIRLKSIDEYRKENNIKEFAKYLGYSLHKV